jgi:hypothetical protein
MKIYVKYSFIFDPSELWQHISQLNNDMASFFRERGFEMEIVESANQDNSEFMIYLRKIPELPPLAEEKTPQQILSQIEKKRDYKGKFRK